MLALSLLLSSLRVIAGAEPPPLSPLGFSLLSLSSDSLSPSTEGAFSGVSADGRRWDANEDGLYVNALTGLPLFLSDDKRNSGAGWPTFDAVIGTNETHTRAQLRALTLLRRCSACRHAR